MSSDLVPAAVGGEASAPEPAPSSPGEPIPGERLGVPEGATRVIADYGRGNPSYVFLLVVAIVTLAADVVTKAWAASHLENYATLEVWPRFVTLVLARNRGGAWGLLQSTSENVRRPFFLLVSVAAIAFIMTLYRRLQPRQTALKWGLPLVLGGALGNVLDRVRYGHVIDFIDCHIREKHWPTFNVADVAICVGVGLMALDMFFTKRGPVALSRAPMAPPAQSGEPVPDWREEREAEAAAHDAAVGGAGPAAPSASE